MPECSVRGCTAPADDVFHVDGPDEQALAVCGAHKDVMEGGEDWFLTHPDGADSGAADVLVSRDVPWRVLAASGLKAGGNKPGLILHLTLSHAGESRELQLLLPWLVRGLLIRVSIGPWCRSSGRQNRLFGEKCRSRGRSAPHGSGETRDARGSRSTNSTLYRCTVVQSGFGHGSGRSSYFGVAFGRCLSPCKRWGTVTPDLPGAGTGTQSPCLSVVAGEDGIRYAAAAPRTGH